MPPKRKAASSDVTPSIARTLRNFAGISKSTSTNTLTKKQKVVGEPTKNVTIIQDGDEDVLLAPPPAPTLSKKRARKVSPAPSPKRTRRSAPAAEELPTPPASDDCPALPSPPASQPSSSSSSSLSALPALHSALLTTLTLHHSHTHTAPTYLTLWPQIERLSSHKLTLPLLRQLITLSAPHLSLYTQSGILRISRSSSSAFLESQKSAFLAALHAYTTLSDVPECAIEERVDQTTALRAKPKRALAALKAKAKVMKPLTMPAAGGTKQRALGLLERIAAKKNPVSLSAEEKETMAAEARAGEVEVVLKSLRVRGSVGLKEVVDAVCGSLRSPISRGEAERAVRICCTRVEWGMVVESGGVAAVVFTRGEEVRRFV